MPILVGLGLGLLGAGAAVQFIGTLVASAVYSRHQRRKAAARARAQYNASLRDRLEMVDLQPDAPRSLVLGRVRAVEGVRRRWVSGTNSEKLTLVISFAGHRIDAFEQWYLDDTPVSLDGNGWVITAPWNKSTLVSGSETLNWPGGTPSVTLPHVPVADSIVAAWAATETLDAGQVAITSVVGAVVTLSSSGPPDGTQVTITYQWTDTASRVRIRPYLGTDTQNVGGDLAAEYPGKITSTDKFAGIALAVVDLLYDPDVFPQGRPNITARMRGARLYDPRADSTVAGGSGSQRADDPSTWAWSENAALCVYHYATWRHGYALPAAETLITDVMAAADACDESTDFTLRKADGSTSTVTLPRYRCGIVIPSDADPRQAMADLLETMAGREGWAGGVWRFRAGAVAASAATMAPSWLALPAAADGGAPAGDAVITITGGTVADDRINRVSGVCVDPDQRWQVLPFPAVEDAVLVAAYGEEPTEVELQGVNHIAHAQHLASILIRQAQAGLRITAQCNMHAYRCELFDVLTLELPRYGMTAELGKLAEVTGWAWHPTQAIRLQLAETSAAIYEPAAELVGRDPAPNGALPSVRDVEQLEIVEITSGTAPLSDSSVLVRTRVEWTPAVQDALRIGGQVEVQYVELADPLPDGDWPSWMEPGDAISATIPSLRAGYWYVFRVRGVKPMVGVRGPWSTQVAHKVAGIADVQLQYRLQLEPASLVLEADAAGVVNSWAGAVSTASVVNSQGDDATADWDYSITAYGVVATLSGAYTNVITLTAWDAALAGAAYNTVMLQLHLDGDFTDSSKYKRTPTYTGSGLSFVAGAFDDGLQVDAASGTTDTGRLRFVDPGFRVIGGTTWSMRAKIRVTAGHPGGLGNQQQILGNDYKYLYLINAATGLEIGGLWNTAEIGSVNVVTVTGAVALNTWIDVEVAYGSDRKLRLFINGTLMRETPAQPAGLSDRILPETSYIDVGSAYGNGELSGNLALNGRIDEVRYILGGTVPEASYTVAGTPYPDGPYLASAYVDVTASKAGSADLTARLNISTIPAAQSVVTSSVSVPTITLQADWTGAVSSYTGATSTVSVRIDGVETVSTWSAAITPSDAGLSATYAPSTGVLTITSMSTALASGYVDILLTRAARPAQALRVNVAKAQAPKPAQTGSIAPAVIVLQGDANGIVSDYTGAQCTGTMFEGGVEASGWSWSHTASAGLTVSRSGSVVTVTAIAANTDTATITLTASKAGWTTTTLVCTVTKNRAGRERGGNYDAAGAAASPADASARLEFRTDGTVYAQSNGGTAVQVGSWYSPTTAGIGSGYKVRWDLLVSNGSFGGESGDAVGTWHTISSDRGVTLTSTENTVGIYRNRTYAYTVRRLSDDVQVANGVLYLEAVIQ